MCIICTQDLLGTTLAMKPSDGISGSLMHRTDSQCRNDGQYEVSVLGRVVGCPAEGSDDAAQKKDTHSICKASVPLLYGPSSIPLVIKSCCMDAETLHGLQYDLVDNSDSARAGDAGSRRSESSGKTFADGVPLNSISRREALTATSCGTAEF